MVQPGMPQFGQPNQGGNNNVGMGKLNNTDKIVLINDNTTCEKCKQEVFPFWAVWCCPIRYRVANNGKGYEVGDQTLFMIQETKRCCGNEWTVFNTNREPVNVFTKTGPCLPCFSLCCGGPGFNVNDVINGEKGARVGAASVPACQCFDNGYDIIDGDDKRFFVGDVYRCCHKRMEFEPVWNDQKNELEKMNVRVRPCLKKYMPCLFCMEDYYVVDFPQHAKQSEKTELVAGALMSERFRKVY